MYITLYYNGFPIGLWRRVLERKKSELVPIVGTYIKMRVCVCATMAIIVRRMKKISRIIRFVVRRIKRKLIKYIMCTSGALVARIKHNIRS